MNSSTAPNLQNSVTVIVCTHNRCNHLGDTLESIAASEMPSSVEWEVLVVDNNSSDKTREFVRSFSQKYPDRFRYLFEPRQGKSHALNAGIANAHGEILAFTDDDVIVEPTWLRKLTGALDEGEWNGVGGRILPMQPIPMAPWLPEPANEWTGIVCGYFDQGNNPGELHRAPFGANMAYRKAAFAQFGGFRTDLGPGAESDTPRPNEDTEFGRRLLRADKRLKYEPLAAVYHLVLQGRLTQRYFFSWWFDYGRAMIRELGQRPYVWGIPRDYFRLARCALTMPGVMCSWLFSRDPRKRFANRCWARFAAGRMVEIYRRSIAPSAKRKQPDALAEAGTNAVQAFPSKVVVIASSKR